MIINALKWLTNFLETRFPVKVTPVSQAQWFAVTNAWDQKDKKDEAVVSALVAEVETMKKHIEILNLRVGLTRPTQAAFGRKLNG